MLTPVFELSQDDQFVKATIYAPFANVAETEIEFDGKEFLFSSKPYFLRLYLPEEVVENGEESARYDFEAKKFIVNVPKKEYGRYFPGLDMMTKLLTPTGKAEAKRLVEEQKGSDDEDDETRWLVDQTPSAQSALNSTLTHGYGFANRRTGVFSTLRDEISEIVDIKDPDELSIVERREKARQLERCKFNEEHYLADYFSSEEIQTMVELSLDQIGGLISPVPASFSLEERDRMKNLPKTKLSLTDAESNLVLISAVDIVFAYLYDYRTTNGEHTVESGWTISKLSSTLSCVLSWEKLDDAIAASIRRSLCYPLYRNWALSVRVLDDVETVFQRGRSTVLKCFLDIHRIFANDSDFRYIFNDLLITDYCVWIQDASDSLITNYAKMIKEAALAVTKARTELPLDELELVASLSGLEVDDDPDQEIAQLDSDDDSK